MAWKLEIDGRAVTIADLTLGQAVQLQELTGQPWPDPAAGAAALASLIAVVAADGDPKLLDGCATVAAKLRLVDAMGMLTVEEG